MIIKIGNLEFGGNSKYQIEPGIAGLDSASIRTGDGLYAGVDGAYVSSQLYGARTITFTGFYLASNCTEIDDLRLNLLTNLRIRYLYPILITTFSQKHYFAEGYITDIKAEVTGSRGGEFQITILCPDPIIYDGGDGTSVDSAWIEENFYKAGAGGFVISYPTPVNWTAGQQYTIINNRGTVDTSPIINLNGSFSSPTIRNLTTGKFMTISRTISSGNVVIDMKKRIITLNGTSIAANRSITSSWWTLIPGENRIVLETNSTSNTNYGTIRYKQGYQGI